jgi:HEAT repeat protein
LNAVSYLTELKSVKAKDSLVTLISGKNKVLALAAIRAMGKLRALDKVDDLLKLYQDSETDPNYKPDLIWAFGEMKAVSAVDLLLKEYDENDAQPLLQRSILEALGKIGDGRAWDRVEAALGSSNTNLRTAAVATLASYPGHGDSVALLTTALRDGQPAVREAAAQAAKTSPQVGLKDLLTYRAKKDPEAKVRIAALRALAAYDDGPSLVLGLLSDRKTDPAVWRESLNLAVEQKYPGTFDALKKVLEEDNKDKNGTLAEVVASVLLPQREAYRSLFGLALASDKAPARSAALRAIGTGKFTEYDSLLRTLAAKDPDPGVKAQASAILKDWSTASEPVKK